MTTYPFYTLTTAAVSFPAVPVVAWWGLTAATIFELAILGGIAVWSTLRSRGSRTSG